MNLRLAEKTALITGAGSGIGKAIALRFAREGAILALNDINEEKLEQTCEEIRAISHDPLLLVADVSNSEDVQKMVKRFYEKNENLDILVNNAGIGASLSEITQLKEEQWQRILDINLTSVFLMCKYFGKRMRKQNRPENELRGKIINIASMRGRTARANYGDYSVSKFGAIALTQTLAQELGKRRITVNAICPGLIYTPLYGNATYEDLATLNAKTMPGCLPHKPVGYPEDVASTALHIASTDCDWVTGQSFAVSGGQAFL